MSLKLVRSAPSGDTICVSVGFIGRIDARPRQSHSVPHWYSNHLRLRPAVESISMYSSVFIPLAPLSRKRYAASVTGGIVVSLSDQKDTITSLSWRGDGALLASGSEDWQIIIWSAVYAFPAATISPKPRLRCRESGFHARWPPGERGPQDPLLQQRWHAQGRECRL